MLNKISTAKIKDNVPKKLKKPNKVVKYEFNWWLKRLYTFPKRKLLINNIRGTKIIHSAINLYLFYQNNND